MIKRCVDYNSNIIKARDLSNEDYDKKKLTQLQNNCNIRLFGQDSASVDRPQVTHGAGNCICIVSFVAREALGLQRVELTNVLPKIYAMKGVANCNVIARVSIVQEDCPVSVCSVGPNLSRQSPRHAQVVNRVIALAKF